MKKTAFTATLATMMLTASCYSDIDMEKYREEAQVTINCIANSDTTVTADVCRTWFFADNHASEDIMELDVTVYVDGIPVETMTYHGDKYLSNVRPKAGQLIGISTTVDGTTVTAEDRMPQKTIINSVDIVHTKISNGGNGNIIVHPDGTVQVDDFDDLYTYNITFDNKASERRYYFVSISEIGNEPIGTLDYTSEPAFLLTMERINKTLSGLKIEGNFGLPFTNEGLSDNECSIQITEKGSHSLYTTNNNGRIISLYSISEAYYKYVISLLANDTEMSWQAGMVDIGLADPVRIYNNIKGGTGIMGCLHRDTATVFLSTEH